MLFIHQVVFTSTAEFLRYPNLFKAPGCTKKNLQVFAPQKILNSDTTTREENACLQDFFSVCSMQRNNNPSEVVGSFRE